MAAPSSCPKGFPPRRCRVGEGLLFPYRGGSFGEQTGRGAAHPSSVAVLSIPVISGRKAEDCFPSSADLGRGPAFPCRGGSFREKTGRGAADPAGGCSLVHACDFRKESRGLLSHCRVLEEKRKQFPRAGKSFWAAAAPGRSDKNLPRPTPAHAYFCSSLWAKA